MTNPKFVDVFSGAGGMGLGLTLSGFENVLSIDSDKDAIKTLMGHSEGTAECADIQELINRLEVKQDCLGKVDILVGGPPCQGFCAINPKRHENDPRNSMIDAFLRVAELIQPRVILLENVTGLLSLADGFAIKKIVLRLNELGFNADYKVLQAAHYGAPQSRWRLFVVGYHGKSFAFPEPEFSANITPNFIRGRELTFRANESSLFNRTSEPRNVWDAISDLPAIENGEALEDQPYQVPVLSEYQDWLRNGSDLIVGHQTRKLAPVNMDRILALPREGMNWTCLPPKLIPDNLKRMLEKYGDGVGSKTRFSRLQKNGLFSTIVTSPDPYWGAFIHPTQNRVISVREAARAQSFPDYVKFEGSLVSKYRQIGNAVPPLLAAAIGKKIREVL